jgi:hypothetical protein
MWRIAGLLYVVAVWWLLKYKPADYLAWLVVASTAVIVLTIEHVGRTLLEWDLDGRSRGAARGRVWI